MPATMSTVSGILKEVYEGRLNEQLNDDVVTLRRIERTSEGTTTQVGGKYTTFPVHTRRNTGIGARREMEDLPEAGQQGAAAATVKLKYQYGAAQLSGQTLELVNTDIQAFTSALDFEMNGLRNDLAKDLNRQVYGDGSGKIGTVTSVVTDTEIPVDRADLFNLGDRIDIVTLPATVSVSDRYVEAIDIPGKTITISGANVTTVVGQIITRKGSGPVSSTENREWTGLEAIVTDSGELYGIDPTDEPVWTANVDDNSGTPRAVSEGLMTLMADTIRTRGGRTTVIFTTLGIRRAYANLLQTQRTFSNVKDFTGGFSGIGFTTDNGEIPVVVDVDATPGQMIFLNEKQIKVYKTHDWKFMDRDGSKWERVPNKDAYRAMYYQYSEIGTHRRNSHGKIVDLIEE